MGELKFYEGGRGYSKESERGKRLYILEVEMYCLFGFELTQGTPWVQYVRHTKPHQYNV